MTDETSSPARLLVAYDHELVRESCFSRQGILLQTNDGNTVGNLIGSDATESKGPH